MKRDDPEAVARAMWRWRGQGRPPWAEPTGDGQESVWDYPRPPRLVADTRRVVVRLGGVTVAETTGAARVLETAGAPTFYLPPGDVDAACLVAADGTSFCEWKGTARYYDVVAGGRRAARLAWSYPDPLPAFEGIRDWVAFYPTELDCEVGGERVRPQPGGFYAGWVTGEIVGPFKGSPGSEGW